MIDPNARHARYGQVVDLHRNPYRGDIGVTVRLDNGVEYQELGFLYHKSLKLGDQVLVSIGFSIMSDTYGIKEIRRTKRGA